MNELRIPDPFALEPFDESFRAFMRPWRFESALATPSIRIDLSEQDGSYTLKAEIPGVRKEDIDVRIDGNQVSISAELKSEKQEKQDGRVLRSERLQGFASRSLTLACPVDEAGSEASYKDGILMLKLPKKAPTSTKRLNVG